MAHEGRRHGGLPAELTSFVGREAEVAAVKRLFAQSRLVTLTGPGGVGKTRIALRVAAELQETYADGVSLVELSALRDTELLPYTVAAALGLPEQTARPVIDVLVEYLKGRRLLLIVDNCEHIIDACAILADALLRGSADLCVLATSRQPLNSAGEHTLPIAPMSVPGNDDEPLRHTYDALTLFAERAAAVVPGFAVTEANWSAVAALCRRLDGIPLAIELAVVRLQAFSLEQMVSLLDDRFRLLKGGVPTALPRHQMLRTAIGWSHELCTPEERLLWVRLSVFAGDFDLAAMEEVCPSGDLAGGEILEHLMSLVDKSIVIRVESDGGARYRLLDTIRDYGREWLAALGQERELQERHRDFYLAMAEKFDAEWLGSDQVAWCRRLNQERPNLRVALEFCFTEEGEAKVGLAMATALAGYWLCSARLSEGRYWIDRGLRLLPDPVSLRARALWLAGWFAILQGTHVAAEPLLKECRALAERIGDDSALAYATQHLGGMYLFQGEAERGLALYEDALARFRELEDRRGLVIILFAIGFFYILSGEVDRGLAACDESLRINGDNNERWCRGYALDAKGIGFWVMGDHRRSAEVTCVNVRMKHELGDLMGIVNGLELLGWVAAEESRYQRTAWLLGAAHILWRKIIGKGGSRWYGMEILQGYHETAERRARQALGQGGFEESFQWGTELTLDEVVQRATEVEPELPPTEPTAPTEPGEPGTALGTLVGREPKGHHAHRGGGSPTRRSPST